MQQDNVAIRSFLERWKKLDFQSKDETFVREAFITPLLETLGYSDTTLHRILREDKHALRAPFHHVGRKRIDIDYVPTLRLKKFWIIEAKPGSSRSLSMVHLLQAHLYAVHPEVQVRYIVITNGREVRLYDAHDVSSRDDYMVLCRQRDCETTFWDLYNFLSVKSMLLAIRRHSLSTVASSLEVEIDEHVLTELQGEIARIVTEARPGIERRAKELEAQAWRHLSDLERTMVEQSDWRSLLAHMDVPTNARFIFGAEVMKRVAAEDPPERARLLTDLVGRCTQARPHNIYFMHVVDALIRLVVGNIQVPATAMVPSPREALERIATQNMAYWISDEMRHALAHLDNTILRVAKKFCMKFYLAAVQRAMRDRAAVISKEAQLSTIDTLAGRMLQLTVALAQHLWATYGTLADSHAIWERIWNLQAFEAADLVDVPRYPDGESDLLQFAWYGRTFDLLSLGTWDALSSAQPSLVAAEAPAPVLAIAVLSRDQVVAQLPQPMAPPPLFMPRPETVRADVAQHVANMTEAVERLRRRAMNL